MHDSQINIDKDDWTGKDFEFLIAGEIDVFEDFDNIMTPNKIAWKKVVVGDWNFYKVGADEYTYSIEPPGIQMTFNPEVLFSKAKMIADEVIQNIKSTGQYAELIILEKSRTYGFE